MLDSDGAKAPADVTPGRSAASRHRPIERCQCFTLMLSLLPKLPVCLKNVLHLPNIDTDR